MNIKIALVTLVLPAVMEVSGLVMMLHPPKERNMFFGYRTRRSLLSKETWDFANYYGGALYVYFGFYIVTATLLTDIVLRVTGAGTRVAGVAALVMVLVQALCFVIPVCFVEAKLKSNFDSEGNLTNTEMMVKPSAAYDDSDWDDWKKDEWKDAWRDEYNDWELWKQKKDAEIAAEKQAAVEEVTKIAKDSGDMEMEKSLKRTDETETETGSGNEANGADELMEDKAVDKDAIKRNITGDSEEE